MVRGQGRLGVNLVSLIVALREEGRLPIRTIQWYLETVHQLRLSAGAGTREWWTTFTKRWRGPRRSLQPTFERPRHFPEAASALGTLLSDLNKALVVKDADGTT